MRVFHPLVFCAIILAAVASGYGANFAAAQNENAIGSWRLNLAKSKYNPGPVPKALTVAWENLGDAVKFTAETTAADGKIFKSEYTAKIDGKEYPMKGNPAADTVTLKMIDGSTVERTDKKDGKVVYVLRRTITGKVMTVTVKGTNPQGQPVDNVLVFDKQ